MRLCNLLYLLWLLTGGPNSADWEFEQGGSVALFKMRFLGRNAEKFHPVTMPLKLEDGIPVRQHAVIRSENWRVGWQHRNYASWLDPAEDLANELIAFLLDSPLAPYMKLEEEDNVASDLANHYEDLYRSSSSEKDLTACDKECGYCGHCSY